MPDKHKDYQRGKQAEKVAELYLILKGYRILSNRAVTGRGTQAGEIDLIAKRGKTLVFLEVKARKTYEEAAYAITPTQQQRIRRGAEVYLKYHPQYAKMNYRFDVILIMPWHWPKHLKNAF